MRRGQGWYRAGVVAAVQRRLARTAARNNRIDARWQWATVAGCPPAQREAESTAPLPRAAGYSDAVEAFLAAQDVRVSCVTPDAARACLQSVAVAVTEPPISSLN